MKVKTFINTRKHKRLSLKMPVLVRRADGREEISCTENISMGGFATILTLDLDEGESVTTICPYMEGGQNNIEQQAECRWGAPLTPGGSQKVYGFCLQKV